MRKPYALFLTMVTLFPVIAHSGTTSHLLQPEVGPSGRIVGVHFVADGEAPAKRHLRFGDEGGRIDLSAGVLEGRAEDGSGIAIPLSRVTSVRIRFERADKAREFEASVGALVAGSEWPPSGRIRQVLLASGVTIDFDIIGPGLDLKNQTLFWSWEGEAVTSIPFAEIALVQIRSNSFVTDFNDLAKFGALAEVELESGELVAVLGRTGIVDLEADLIQCNGETLPLAKVCGVRVVDCRGREKDAPVVAGSSPSPGEEASIKVFDFENLELNGQRVKLREAGGGRSWIEGRVVAQDAQSLEILLEEGTMSVPLEEIEKLEISRGKARNAGTGALVGGIVVGAAGLGLGIAMASDDFFDTSGSDVVAVTFLGIAAGALVGGAIGAAIKTEKWDEVKKLEFGVIVAPDNNMGIALTWDF